MMSRDIQKSYSKRLNERGNVFTFVLMGVALFAALAFTVSRGMRSQTTTVMSERDAVLAAADIMAYAQRLERAVSHIQRTKSCSENELSFENSIVAGYTNASSPGDNRCHIFHPAGGGVTWKMPQANVNDGSDWHFTGATCIADLGSGSMGCDADGVSNEELIAVLPNLDINVCQEISKKLGQPSILSDLGGSYSATKFTGSFADGTELILGSSLTSQCYEDGGNYHFYFVLSER